MWYEKEGKDTDVVLYSKVIVTRNIKGFPFPVKMSMADKENVLEKARQMSSKSEMNFIRCDELNDDSKEDMFKNYYSDAKFLNDSVGTGFLVGKEEGQAVVINNRNHIEIESYISGSDVVTAYKKADKIASEFEKELEIAYSEKLGFLSPDIQTVGMGIQIVNAVSIPGIEKTVGAVNALNDELERYDWQLVQVGNIKGAGMYALVNKVTLGIDEKELFKRATEVLSEVVNLERSCRKNICSKKPSIVEDQYYRSYALLKYARRMEAGEAMEHLNWLRIGKEFIKGDKLQIEWNKINRMTHLVRRDYKVAISKGTKAGMHAQARATGIRSVIGEEA